MRTDRGTDGWGAASYRIVLAVALLPGVAGCVSAVGAPPRMAVFAPALDPIAFFAGSTHGTGTLHVIASKAQATDVTGRGIREGENAITLEQDVVRGNAAASHRTWHLRRIAAGRYEGNLTDAVGPVVAENQGSTLVIRFAMRHGLQVIQHLYPQPGGRVVLNTMTVRKWGIVVARLDERIERR